MITFYGHLTGRSSYPVVCKAILTYLKQQKYDVYSVDLRSHPRTPNHENRTGVKLLFGFPEWHIVTPKHEVNIGYHVCDVDLIDDRWVHTMNAEDIILTPSVWCKSVFRRCGVTKPIHVVQHGVDPAFVPGEAPDHDLRETPFHVLHFCSSQDPSRKGTLELIRAFGELDNDDGADFEGWLRIVTASAQVRDAVEGLPYEYPNITLADPPGSGGRLPEEQARRYQSYHVIVVPSRAEGFGMIGLEALACGVPIIGTRVTGHKEWFGRFKGAVEVKTGPMEFCGGPGRAPSIDVASLKEALLYSYKHWDILREEAKAAACQVQREFSWHEVLRPLAEIIDEAEASSLS